MNDRRKVIDEAIKEAETDRDAALESGDFELVNRLELYLRVLEYIKDRFEKDER